MHKTLFQVCRRKLQIKIKKSPHGGNREGMNIRVYQMYTPTISIKVYHISIGFEPIPIFERWLFYACIQRRTAQDLVLLFLLHRFSVCKKHGLKKIRVHDLRHSHASYLINKGFSPLVIKERLGHDNINTTLQTYSHLYPSTTEDIVNTIAKELMPN